MANGDTTNPTRGVWSRLRMVSAELWEVLDKLRTVSNELGECVNDAHNEYNQLKSRLAKLEKNDQEQEALLKLAGCIDAARDKVGAAYEDKTGETFEDWGDLLAYVRAKKTFPQLYTTVQETLGLTKPEWLSLSINMHDERNLLALPGIENLTRQEAMQLIGQLPVYVPAAAKNAMNKLLDKLFPKPQRSRSRAAKRARRE